MPRRSKHPSTKPDTQRLGLLMMLILVPALGFSHPHIWIDTAVTPRFNSAGLAELGVEWTFDEYYSSAVLVDADADGDGTLDPEEIAVVRELMFSHLVSRSYFFFIFVNNRRFSIPEARSFTSSITQGRLVFQFTLDTPVPWQDLPALRIANIDQSYYTDFLLTASETPISTRGRSIQPYLPTETWDFGEWGRLPVQSLRFRILP